MTGIALATATVAIIPEVPTFADFFQGLPLTQPSAWEEGLNALEAASSLPTFDQTIRTQLATAVSEFRTMLGIGGNAEEAKTRLVAILKGFNGALPTPTTKTIRFAPSAASALAHLKYRPTQLHYSPSPEDSTVSLPVPAGVSETIPLRAGQSVPRVLSLSLFPPFSNGSGTFATAVAKDLKNRGGDVSMLFLGARFDSSASFPQYLFPFTSPFHASKAGAALAPLPVFESNPASPDGVRYRDMTPDEMEAYAEGVADAVAVAARDMQPDVLLVNHAWIGAEAARRTGLPYVVVCHGNCCDHVRAAYPQGPQGPLSSPYPSNLGEYVFAGVQGANSIITATDLVSGAIPAVYGVDLRDVYTIPHGFSGDVFAPAQLDRAQVLAELGISSEGITHVVAFAGRMAEAKGVDTLIRAAAKVKEVMPGVRFVLAGGGGKLQEYKDLAANLDVADTVIFVGNRDHNQLSRFFNIADVGLVTSNTELFGIVALEEAGTGLPIIASDVGGLRQIITEEVGVRVPRGDDKAFAKAVIQALRENMKARMGSGVAAHVHANYSWTSSGDRLVPLLRKAVGEGRRSQQSTGTAQGTR
ncbi:MAG: glycosyltransferase family 4 protein [Deltaproteobacteria bacterium]|nr:glycosyltransferase family 4 protein [Deltaproteobacteria bacterium]